ncbi:hypothetical protein MM707_30545, partial [Klebsiella pneumoniae]|nr:hypothetical protein [Klebsiella pneumoniae]
VSANGGGWQVLDTGAALPLTIQTEMPWDIGFINIENPAGGITVSAMGINGAQLTHWSKWRADRMNDLAQTGADLVILSYGTNEAFGDNIDIADTEQKWLDTVRQIRDSLPAAGQGALGIEIAAHREDLYEVLKPLNHDTTHACVTAERALARALGGSCQVPLAAYCTEENGLLTLRGLVGHPDGSVVLRADAQAPAEYADALGRAVAKKLADDGARELIGAVLNTEN